jgi:hypothetical protein
MITEASTETPEQEPASNLSELLEQALTFHQEGRLEECEPLYLRILEAEHDHFDARHLLGILRHQQGRSAEALELIGAALKANPSSSEALSNYGVVLQQLSRNEEALESFNNALGVRPDYIEAMNNRANVLLELNRPQEALESYNRALELRPDYAEALYGRGIALKEIARKQDSGKSYSANEEPSRGDRPGMAVQPHFGERPSDTSIRPAEEGESHATGIGDSLRLPAVHLLDPCAPGSPGQLLAKPTLDEVSFQNVHRGGVIATAQNDRDQGFFEPNEPSIPVAWESEAATPAAAANTQEADEQDPLWEAGSKARLVGSRVFGRVALGFAVVGLALAIWHFSSWFEHQSAEVAYRPVAPITSAAPKSSNSLAVERGFAPIGSNETAPAADSDLDTAHNAESPSPGQLLTSPAEKRLADNERAKVSRGGGPEPAIDSTPEVVREPPNSSNLAAEAQGVPVQKTSEGAAMDETPATTGGHAPSGQADRGPPVRPMEVGTGPSATGKTGVAGIENDEANSARNSASDRAVRIPDPKPAETALPGDKVPPNAVGELMPATTTKEAHVESLNEIKEVTVPGSADRKPKIGTNGSADIRRLDAEEVAMMVKRGEQFMAVGDIPAARLMLQRAAEARDPRGALLLGETYDPMVLKTLNIVGIVPDISLARTWYERAREFGSADALKRLDDLAAR